jgi:dinuclear metal center YbgI/SA1388 family protein
MLIKEITDYLEEIAPLSLQENYDNCGLLIGNKNEPINGILTTLDCTPEVVEEAINKKCNLIIAHHPIIFSGLKKLTGANYIERTVLLAIKNNIAIYAAHTNFDNILKKGVNEYLATLLGLKQTCILSNKPNQLKKLVFFCPATHADKVRNALFTAGLGQIGNYDSCSFNTQGKGTFRALQGANPFVGEVNKVHTEDEIKIEGVFSTWQQPTILNALFSNHPYEEVAYEIYNLDNTNTRVGAGIIGELPEALSVPDFLNHLKQTLQIQQIRYTQLKKPFIKKVAVCGGSGSFLIKNALNAQADAYVTSDIKYHDFFDADKQLLIADIGHYETEKHTKQLFFDILTEKFSNFAIHISEINTNPVNYF